MEKQLTCEERIDSALESRLEDINPNFHTMSMNELKDYCAEWSNDIPDGIVYYDGVAFDAGTREEDILDEDPIDFSDEIEQWIDFAQELQRDHVHERILCVDYFKAVKILLSTGGPEDYFEVYYNEHGIINGRYFFKDWFDGASRYISADQAEDVINGLGIYLDDLD